MNKERSPQTADKYIVRFPEGMRELIADAATASGRSINAEINERLRKSFEPSAEARELAHKVASLEVMVHAYKVAASAAEGSALILMDRLAALASELPKDNRIARQCLALIDAMNSKDPTKLAASYRELFGGDEDALKGISEFEAGAEKRKAAASRK